MSRLSDLLGRAHAAVRGRVRLLLTAGVALGLLIGGTSAIWSETVTAETGRFAAGEVDLKLSSATGAPQVDDYEVAISDLWPGDSRNQVIRVYNAGTLRFSVSMSQALTDSSWPTGAPTGMNPFTVTATPLQAVTLDPGDYATVTVTATFSSFTTDQMGAAHADWRNSFQGASGVLKLTFTATNT